MSLIIIYCTCGESVRHVGGLILCECVNSVVSLKNYCCSLEGEGFETALSELSKMQRFVEYPDRKTVRLTQAEITKAGTVSPPTRNEKVQGRIKELLQAKAIQIFEALTVGRSLARP